MLGTLDPVQQGPSALPGSGGDVHDAGMEDTRGIEASVAATVVADVAVVVVVGRADEGSAGDLGDRILDNHHAGLLVVELSELELSSEAARHQLLLHLGCHRRRHAVRLVHRDAAERRALRSFHQNFPVLPDLATACAGSGAVEHPLEATEAALRRTTQRLALA